jgi:hypothetical protein
VTERGEKGESWADTGLVGRKEGWVGGLLGALRAEEVRRAGEKEEERRWATLGWNERREGGREVWFFSVFSNTFFQTFKSLNSFKTFSSLNSFPKISNQIKNF